MYLHSWCCGEAKQYSLLSCCMTSFEFKTLFSMKSKSTIHIERTFVGYLRARVFCSVVSWMHMLHHILFYTYLIQYRYIYEYNTRAHRKNNNTFKWIYTLLLQQHNPKLTGAAGRSDTLLCSTRFHGMPRDVLPCGWSWSLLYLSI